MRSCFVVISVGKYVGKYAVHRRSGRNRKLLVRYVRPLGLVTPSLVWSGVGMYLGKYVGKYVGKYAVLRRNRRNRRILVRYVRPLGLGLGLRYSCFFSVRVRVAQNLGFVGCRGVYFFIFFYFFLLFYFFFIFFLFFFIFFILPYHSTLF